MVFKYLKNKKNVIGVDDSGDEIDVFVTKKYDSATAQRLITNPKVNFWESDLVPKFMWKGFRKKKTNVVEIGEVKAEANRKKYNPVLGGCEIGVENSPYIGTAGGLVQIKRYGDLTFTGQWESLLPFLEKYNIPYTTESYVLTNTHVAVPDIREKNNKKTIVQPGSWATGSRPIGVVSDYEPILPKRDNYIDAAIVKLDSDALPKQVPGWELKGFNFNYYKGMPIKKYGRTTLSTRSKILYTDVTMKISYPEGSMPFKGVVLAERMSSGGDSGSLILDENNYIVGLHFAGGPNHSIFIPIERVVKRFNLYSRYGDNV